MKIRIQGARLIDPSAGTDAIGDLCIAEGKLVAATGFSADRLIDGQGLAVLPGLIDLSARVADAQEAQAALAGGVSCAVLPAGQRPGRAQLALGPLFAGEQLAPMAGLLAQGVAGFEAHGWPAAQPLLRAMQYAAELGATLWLRPQESSLAQGGVVAAGAYATRLGLPGIPVEAETLALHTIFTLQRATGARVHLCRLSSAAGVELLRQARQQGLPVTADISVQHLHLTDLDIGFYDTRCHLQPPLRGQRDRDALAQALADGTIDALCSDHTPVTQAGKNAPFAQSLPGASAVELLLPLALKWAHSRGLALPQALACLSSGPARVLGRPAPSLQPGAAADLCLLDPYAEYLLSPQSLLSGSAQTPFAGMMLPGRPLATLVGGDILWERPV